MSDSAHDRFRERLVALQTDAVPAAALAGAGARCGWWREDRRWRRRSGRFEPHAAAFVDLVYETADAPQAIGRVEIHEEPPARRGDGACVIESAIGWMRVTPIGFDAAIPAIGQLMQGRAIAVRYHPGRRCTMRVERGGESYFAKAYANANGKRAYDATVDVWRATRTPSRFLFPSRSNGIRGC